ncbi:MAG: hypothetical protein ABFD60_01705 [Bryobacteraceae bacterium]
MDEKQDQERETGPKMPYKIITMQELVDEAQRAMSTMSQRNDHRILLGNLVGALVSVTNRLDAAVQALRQMEWTVDDGGTERCPWCGNTRAQGHKADCGRAPFLQALVQPAPPPVPTKPSIILMPGGRA